MTDDGSLNKPLSHLAVPGERLGWIFRDRNQFRRAFAEPAPPMVTPAPHFSARVEARQRAKSS